MRSPPLTAIRRTLYERSFALASGQARLFQGKYLSYTAAAAAAPRTRPIGYDNPASARRLEHERHRIVASDYPVIFWLRPLLHDHCVVFDFGGNIGISYFGFRRVVDFSNGLTGVVYDLPAVVDRSQQIAREEPSPGLRFTTDCSELRDADILMAAGSLQFLEDPIDFLRGIGDLPQHILLNKVPLFGRKAAVRLHAMGTAFCPYHLLNQRELLSTFESRGYQCVDAWSNHDCACYVLFHPELTISSYSGFYFRQLAAAAR